MSMRFVSHTVVSSAAFLLMLFGCTNGQLDLGLGNVDGGAAANGQGEGGSGATAGEGQCDAQLIAGQGTCEMILGYAWDGMECVPISGCSCVGADCAKVSKSLEDCNAAFAPCRGTGGGTAGAGAQGQGGHAGGGTAANGSGADPGTGATNTGGWGADPGTGATAGVGAGGPGPDAGTGAAGPDSGTAGSGGGAQCGGFAGSACPPGWVCMYPEGKCNIPDMAGVCEPQGPGVVDCPAIYNPVCGCDFVTYGNDCEAIASGMSIAYRGPCEQPDGGPTQVCTPGKDYECNDDPTVSMAWGICGPDGNCYCRQGTTVNPRTGKCMVIDGSGSDGGTGPNCSPQDARGSGACYGHLGFAWNGQECLAVTGCSCVGTDCAGLFQTKAECDNTYAACPVLF